VFRSEVRSGGSRSHECPPEENRSAMPVDRQFHVGGIVVLSEDVGEVWCGDGECSERLMMP
jgi:hypothetical protein